MKKLTVVSWLWQGWRPMYDVSHVETLQRMLREHLSIPHEFVCVTDRPEDINFCRAIHTWDAPRVAARERQPNCYRRLALFGPRAQELFGDRILSIDLDTVIWQDIAPLLTDDDFRIVRGTHAPYNGSMWWLKTGTRNKLWTDFDPVRSPIEARMRMTAGGQPYLGSDQAWISHKCPDERTWDERDGVHLFHEIRLKWKRMPTDMRIMFFPGLVKPWGPDVKATYPAIYNQYMRYHKP